MSRKDAQPFQAHSPSDAAIRFVFQDMEEFARGMFNKNGKSFSSMEKSGHPFFVEDSNKKLHLFRIRNEEDVSFQAYPVEKEDYLSFDASRKNKKTKPINYSFRVAEDLSDEDRRSYVVGGGLTRIDD
jgi:hypothetical protein